MSYSAVLDAATIDQWVNAKLDLNTVEARLKEKGFDGETILNYLKAYKKKCCSKRQAKGFIYMAAGAFLGFLACILSLVNPVPSLYEVFLYGLTSIAILVIFAGLYFVFE
jgi:hypothetical protein